MKKEINKDLLYEFIENSTRCILDEIKTDVNFLFKLVLG